MKKYLKEKSKKLLTLILKCAIIYKYRLGTKKYRRN